MNFSSKNHTFMQIRQKPYNLLLLTGIVSVLISFFAIKQTDVINVHLHDAYFVLARKHIFWLSAISALFVWALYLLTSKTIRSKTLAWIHTIITIGTLILFALTLYFWNNFSHPTSWHYYGNSFEINSNYTNLLAIIIGIFFLVQIIFLVNFISGLLRRAT